MSKRAIPPWAWLLKGANPYSPAHDNIETREYDTLTPRGRGVVRWGLLAAHALCLLDLLRSSRKVEPRCIRTGAVPI